MKRFGLETFFHISSLKRWALILCLCMPMSVCAQQEREKTIMLDLQSCISQGLQNNLELQITRNREETAHNNATLANAGALPSLDASVALRPTLSTLDRVESRSTGNVTKNTNVFDRVIDAGVSVSWTIFDGFKIQTNYKQLQMLEQQGETSTRMVIEDLVADIASEYYNYIQQQIRSRNYNYAMELSRERMRIARVNYQIGRFSGLDYHQAEVDYHADSSSYVRQREAVLATNIRLNQLMGNKVVNQLITIPDTTINVRNDLSYDHLWQKTLSSNSSLLYANQNTQMAELDYKKIMSRDYPYLRLSAEYGYTHTHYDINATKLRDNLGLSGGLTIGMKLFDGNRRREKRNAQIAIQNQKLQREQLELNLHANFATLWQSYRNNIDLLDLQKKNLEIAKNNLEIAMERYKLGNLSGFDMRQIEKNLLDAEERVLQVEYDAKICEISLLLISGDVINYLTTPVDE